MRRRLVVAIGGAVVLAVVVVGLGTLLLTRFDARDRGEEDLAARASALAEVLAEARPQRVGPLARRFRGAVGADVARVVGLEDPPPWMDAGDVDRLRAGGTASGRRGDTLVAAAGLVPVDEPSPSPLDLDGAAAAAADPVATRAVVLVDAVDTGTGAAGRWFVVAGVVTVLAGVAAAVAVARSLSRPLVAASEAADRIAGGDLDARVPMPHDRVQAGPHAGGGLDGRDRADGPDGPADAGDAGSGGTGRAGGPGGGRPVAMGPVGRRRDDELARLARSVNAMAGALQQARRAERDFLLSVSHDLRTPLTAITGWAEALADGAAPDPAAAGARIQAAAARLDRLVGDLLDLARLRAHAFTLAHEVVDLRDVAAGTAEGLRPELEDAGLALTVVLSPGPALVTGDSDRLAQVVANLLDNAARHAASRVAVEVTTTGPTATAGPAPETAAPAGVARKMPGAVGAAPETAGAAVRAGTVAIVVTDDGPGIPAADRADVFARLHTGASPAARTARGAGTGTGLGLAIVRELAIAMHAHAEATPPAPGAPGARLVVSFPRAAEEAGHECVEAP